MYDLMIKGHFDAAHALHGYPGECRNLHGHTWDVEVVVRGSELDEVGIPLLKLHQPDDIANTDGLFDQG